MSLPLLPERDVNNISGLQGVQCSRHTSSGTVAVIMQREGGTQYSYDYIITLLYSDLNYRARPPSTTYPLPTDIVLLTGQQTTTSRMSRQACKRNIVLMLMR